MQFDFTLHYRDEFEAARAAFPGIDAAPPARGPAKRPGVPALVAWVVVLTAGLLAYGQLRTAPCPAVAAGRDMAEVTAAVEAPAEASDASADRVYAAGAGVAFFGAAVYLATATYLLARQGAARPYHDKPATALLTDAGVTLRTGAKELTVSWPGVVAVAETPNLFVLKTLGDLRLVLPKRALLDRFGDDHGRIDDLRQTLAARITPLASPLSSAVPS